MTLDLKIEEQLKRHEARFSIAPILPRCPREWSTYLPRKNLLRSLRKATSDHEYAPKRKHIRVAILSTYTHSLTALPPTLIKTLTSISLNYTPPTHSFQTLGDVASPMGNSIYSASSTAGMSVRYHGLRAFKALIVLHSVLQEGPKHIAHCMHDSSELLYWLSSLIRDVQWCHGGVRGYGSLVARYAQYLLSALNALTQSNLAYDFSPLASTSHPSTAFLSKHPRAPSVASSNVTEIEEVDRTKQLNHIHDLSIRLREKLQAEIDGDLISGCKIAAFTLIKQDIEERMAMFDVL